MLTVAVPSDVCYGTAMDYAQESTAPPPPLVGSLQDIFPDVPCVAIEGMDHALDRQVRSIEGMESALERKIWRLASDHGHALLSTANADYPITVLGLPPEVLWLRIGGCTAAQAERALRANAGTIRSLFEMARPGGMFVWNVRAARRHGKSDPI